jgi:hypothetical protein
MDLYELRQAVRDRESFIAFVEAFAAERERAEELERTNPTRYELGGALDWQNSDISSFLYAALQYFGGGMHHQPEDQPSWRMMADLLYFGKIYE